MMFGGFKQVYQHRALIMATTREIVRTRFTNNILGSAWVLIYPLIFLSMYSLVYVHILGVRMPDMNTTDYVILIFSGLVPFLAFSESFSIGSNSVIANRGLLRNTLFPIQFVVLRDVLAGHITMGVGMLLLWISVLITGHYSLSHLVVPFIYLLQIMMVCGLVWIIASLMVFFRDLQQMVPIVILFLMLVSPIAYTDNMVPSGLHFLTHFNPLAWLMHLYRACLLQGVVPMKDLTLFAIFSTTLFLLGYRFITRLKPIFVDYL